MANNTPSGKLVVRMLPVIHKEAAITAKRNHQSLNGFINTAVQEKLQRERKKDAK